MFEELTILIREIDSKNWDIHDVRIFVDRMLNHGASYHQAREYVEKVKKVDELQRAGDYTAAVIEALR